MNLNHHTHPPLTSPPLPGTLHPHPPHPLHYPHLTFLLPMKPRLLPNLRLRLLPQLPRYLLLLKLLHMLCPQLINIPIRQSHATKRFQETLVSFEETRRFDNICIKRGRYLGAFCVVLGRGRCSLFSRGWRWGKGSAWWWVWAFIFKVCGRIFSAFRVFRVFIIWGGVSFTFI